MKLVVLRKYTQASTISVYVLIDSEMKVLASGNILELPWLANQRRISCIEEGTYNVVPHKSPKFGQCFHVQDVRNRSEILIHAGNTAADTLGCLLPGVRESDAKVLRSRTKLQELIRLAPKGFTMEVSSLEKK